MSFCFEMLNANIISIVCSGGEIILIRLADQLTTQKQADRQTFRTAVAVEG